MFNNKKKIENSSGVVKKENRLSRLLRANASFQASLISSERTGQECDYNENQKEIRNAMLVAEYNKAIAIAAMQKDRYLR